MIVILFLVVAIGYMVSAEMNSRRYQKQIKALIKLCAIAQAEAETSQRHADYWFKQYEKAKGLGSPYREGTHG